MAGTSELDKLKETARRVTAGLSTKQKVTAVLAAVALVLGSVTFLKVAGRPSYQPLFTNLQPADAGAITSKLSSSKVPYQLGDGGSTVLVPSNQVYQQRVDMAQAGLPSSGTVGLSLLDKEGLTTSQLTQQADFQRAIQGQLESTIEAIKGVTGAQVNLVMPPTDVFAVSNDQSATASVLVGLEPGATLSSGQVQAIVHLVSSAVANMDPNSVTVVDSNGTMLAGPGVETNTAGQDGQTSGFDAALAASINDMLTQVVGPGKANVKVNADLNFDQVDTTTKSVQLGPNGTPVSAPTSTSSSKQTYTGAGATPAGAGGVLGNTGVSSTAAGANGNYSQQSSDSTFATGEVDQTVKQAPGTIRRLSVAVLLDSSIKGVDVNSIRQLVTAAAGIQAPRGDSLSVVQLPFSHAAATSAKAAASAAASAKRQAQLAGILRALAPLLVLGVAAAVIMRVMRRPRVVPINSPLALGSGHLDAAAAGLPAAAAGATASAPVGGLAPYDPATAGMLDGPARVEDFIEQQPDEVARLLRSWMSERVGADA